MQVDPTTMMTGRPWHLRRRRHGAGERNVTVAVGTARRPRHIDAWLRGAAPPPPKHAPATFERLNTWYYSDAPKTMRPVLDLARRTSASTKCRAA